MPVCNRLWPGSLFRLLRKLQFGVVRQVKELCTCKFVFVFFVVKILVSFELIEMNVLSFDTVANASLLMRMLIAILIVDRVAETTRFQLLCRRLVPILQSW